MQFIINTHEQVVAYTEFKGTNSKLSRQNVEREGCPFGGAGPIEVGDPQETLNDKKEGVTPGAVNGKKLRAEEGHKLIVADRAGDEMEPKDGETGRAGPTSCCHHWSKDDW